MSPTLPDQALDDLLAAFPGHAGLIVKDLADDRTYAHDVDRRFPIASVFKVPIMVELFRQVEAGIRRLDDRYQVHDELCRHGTRRDDCPVGSTWSLGDLCERMIAESNNVATDLILEVIGLESVNHAMDTLGFANTRVCMPIGRWHYMMVGLDTAPINAENDAIANERIGAGSIDFTALPFTDSLSNNVTSARDMADMLEQIYGGRLLGPTSSRQMLAMLHRCGHRRMIPCHVDPTVPIAHKIGQSARIRADVGIVELPQRPVVVAALTTAVELGKARPGCELIANVVKHVVAALYPEALADASRRRPSAS